MKFNKIILGSLLMLAGAMTSCTSGQYWDEPGESATVYAFPKPTLTLNVDADDAFPETVEVTINRSNAGAKETVPVVFTPSKASAGILTGADEVTFEAGSRTATYVINISKDADVNVAYSATVQVEEPEDALIDVTADNQKYTLNFRRVLTLKWADAGEALCISDWVENEEPIAVPVQVATNWPVAGQKVVRLCSPYHVMEPQYANEEGNIDFIVDDDNNVVGLYSSWQYIGEKYDGEYMWLGIGYTGCTFTNEGNVYTINGVFATSEKNPYTALSLLTFETLTWQWNQ
ncbi:MAG: hypothetical protein K2J23_06250 [Muribaculaceae bacterium]|nr:hypothetical protein [Muribaculaceae bacterium]MDE6866979.1 hypothetical protein [Muribaculaceae bacterium]